MGERLVVGLVCLVSIIFLSIATKIPPPHVESPLGAGFWPKIVLTLLLVGSGTQLIKLLFREKAVEERVAQKAAEAQKKEEEETGQKKVLSLFLFGILISFFYILLIKWVGFILVTPIFMAIFMYITGYRKKVMLALVPLVSLAIFLLLFVKATYIPLPRGFSIFKELSVLFY